MLDEGSRKLVLAVFSGERGEETLHCSSSQCGMSSGREIRKRRVLVMDLCCVNFGSKAPAGFSKGPLRHLPLMDDSIFG